MTVWIKTPSCPVPSFQTGAGLHIIKPTGKCSPLPGLLGFISYKLIQHSRNNSNYGIYVNLKIEPSNYNRLYVQLYSLCFVYMYHIKWNPFYFCIVLSFVICIFFFFLCVNWRFPRILVLFPQLASTCLNIF